MRTCCKPEYYTQHVTCTVMEQVPVQKQITVQVCSYHPEERTCQISRCVAECKPEVVVHKERFCVMVPYQTTIKVPVCTPCCSQGCCQ
jgi:hypothetical protein